MKRTDKLTNFIAILLFAAFVVYAAAYAIRSISSTTVTAEAVAAEVRPGAVASGIVIRSETVLTSTEKYVDVTAGDGAKVSVGAPLATAMRSETGLERANRIHVVEREIVRIRTALEELDSAEDLTARDETLRSAVDGVTSAVARHELGGLDGNALNLRSLLFDSSASGATRDELRALENELDSLRNSSSEDTKVLTAESSGVFSAVVDGYEYLSPADLDDLTPAKLSDILERDAENRAGAFGKLVSDFRWYFAAVMSAEDAERLQPGCTATLNFGRWYGSDVFAKVLSISEPEDGSVAVVFSCDSALSGTLAMRRVSADVVYSAYSGIRVPADALRTDEETGQTYVWCITAMVLERKDVEVIYEDEDFAIVARGGTANVLREGNTVVVSGDELYEGKVME